MNNSASIVRASDGLDIPASGLSCEFDLDSWAWTFSATILSVAAAQAVHGQEVIITLNGHQWRMRVDTWRDNRSWGQQSATIGGRGLTAELSSSVLLESSYSEPADRTLVQLAADRLPYGWTLDWQAADWLVPGGVYGFLLPDQRNQHLVIKPRYPTVPWQLDTAQAEVAIPRAIITTLGSDFQPGQAASGIYVSGGHQGITGRVLRQGTAGERQAPTITHPLVCDVLAARAQGVVGLAKAMPKRTQTIELPLSSDTGLILPGALLAVDSWKGYCRGVRVSAGVQGRAMTVRQQLSVERFV